jgi:hypothetical protein
MVNHLASIFDGFQSAVAGACGNDCGHKSHDPPERPSFKESQSDNSGARGDDSRRSHALTPFGMLINQGP